MDLKRYTYGGYSYQVKPFTEDEMKYVPEALRELLCELAEERFTKNSRMVANAMMGAAAIIIDILAQEQISKNSLTTKYLATRKDKG